MGESCWASCTALSTSAGRRLLYPLQNIPSSLPILGSGLPQSIQPSLHTPVTLQRPMCTTRPGQVGTV